MNENKDLGIFFRTIFLFYEIGIMRFIFYLGAKRSTFDTTFQNQKVSLKLW